MRPFVPFAIAALLALSSCSEDDATGAGTSSDGGVEASSEASSGGDSGGTDAGGGAVDSGVNGCAEFVDRTDAAASRELPWDFPIFDDPLRCMKIRAGQTVVWKGDLTVHPLGVDGVAPGDIKLGTGQADVTFASAGVYPYRCITHSSMRGAILVE